MSEIYVKTSGKVRQSNFELFRLVALLFIIAHHFVLYGETPDSTSTINHIVYTIMFIGGKFGVNCFMLISGYFMITSKFSSKKIIRLVLEILFYSVVIYLGVCIINPEEYLSIKNFIDSFLILKSNWFFRVYLFIMLMSPVLNITIKCLSKQNHKKVLIVFFFLITTVSTFPYLGNMYINQCVWFVYMYFVGSYIRKYSIGFLEKKNIAFSFFAVFYISAVILQMIITKYSWGKYLNVKDSYSVFMFFASIGLFFYFKNINIGSIKLINTLAAGAFGVYLIHDNDYMEEILWKDMLNVIDFYSSAWFPVYALLTIISIYLVCCFIDFIRAHTVEKLVLKSKTLDKICCKFDKWYF